MADLDAFDRLYSDLRILSVFLSIDGEANFYHAGSWTVFVRFSGCVTGCTYCDTKYSWKIGGRIISPVDLLGRVKEVGRGVKKITVTGGEPLMQNPEKLDTFLALMIEGGYAITIETDGTYDALQLRQTHPEIRWVFDYKLKSSGAVRQPCLPNYECLSSKEVVKFVAKSSSDIKEVVEIVGLLRTRYACKARMVVSPDFDCFGKDGISKFVDLAREGCSKADIGINLQMHKFIWPEEDSKMEGDSNGLWSGLTKL